MCVLLSELGLVPLLVANAFDVVPLNDSQITLLIGVQPVLESYHPTENLCSQL